MTEVSDRPQLNPLLRIALDIGPLVLFFAVNSRFGIFVGTGVFMVAVLLAIATSYAMTRRLPVMALVSGVIVLVFGGLTIALHNEIFIKVKPTIIYLLFAGMLIFGLVTRRPLLAMVFDAVFNLTEEGWRKLTIRWAGFFIVAAIANEIVWRTQTTEAWLGFKAFGMIPATFVFAALQYPLLTKYDAGTQPTPSSEA